MSNHSHPVTLFLSFTNSNSQSIVFDTHARLISVHLEYTSDATAGNRQITMTLRDPGGHAISHAPVQASQAASLTRHYEFSSLSLHDNSFIGPAIIKAIN